MANLFQPSLSRITDSNGDPVPSARMFFYLTGTTTPATWYTDQAGATPGTNPLTADSSGKFTTPAYLDDATTYRIRVTDADGTQIWPDVDPVRGFDSGMVSDAAATAVTAATTATTQAGIATTQATAATTAKTGAETAQGLAEDARDEAEDAKDVAVTAAASPTLKVQTNSATPTVPPSGAADGDYYWVVDADATFLTLYLNTTGTGAAVSVGGDPVEIPLLSTIEAAVADAEAAEAAAIAAAAAPTNALREARAQSSAVTDGLWLDADGNVIIGLEVETSRPTGYALEYKGDAKAEPVALSSLAVTNTDWLAVQSYGQSQSNGTVSATELTSGTGSAVALSTTQPYSNITFTGGLWTSTGTGKTDGTKALIEEVNGVTSADSQPANSIGESWATAGTSTAVERALIRNGTLPSDKVYFAANSGRTAQTVAQLSKAGAAAYTNIFLPHMNAIKTLATAASKTVAAPWFVYIQGENDSTAGTSRSSWVASTLQLFEDMRDDAVSVYGAAQVRPPHILMVQTNINARLAGTNKGAVQLGTLDVIASDPYAHFVTSLYHFPNALDGIHTVAIQQRRLGCYVGRAAEQVEAGYEPDWCKPIAAWSRGQTVYAKFRVPQKPLVFDQREMPLTVDYGILIKDDTGTLTLSNFRIVEGDTVAVDIDRALDDNAVWRYAMDYGPSAAVTVPTNGGCGNVRDSTPERVTISGTDYGLWHALPQCELSIVELEVFA